MSFSIKISEKIDWGSFRFFYLIDLYFFSDFGIFLWLWMDYKGFYGGVLKFFLVRTHFKIEFSGLKNLNSNFSITKGVLENINVWYKSFVV